MVTWPAAEAVLGGAVELGPQLGILCPQQGHLHGMEVNGKQEEFVPGRRKKTLRQAKPGAASPFFAVTCLPS
jgi:hypothetical protein